MEILEARKLTDFSWTTAFSGSLIASKASFCILTFHIQDNVKKAAISLTKLMNMIFPHIGFFLSLNTCKTCNLWYKFIRYLLFTYISLYVIWFYFEWKHKKWIKSIKLWFVPNHNLVQWNWAFATNTNFLIPIYLQPNVVNLWYFKLRLFVITEFIVWNV